MQECDARPFSAYAWRLVDQSQSSGPAALEHSVEVVNREADVMNAGPAPGDKPGDWCLRSIWFQELHKALTGREGLDNRSIRIGHLDLFQSEYLTEERELRSNRLEGDSNVRDSGAFQGSFLH